MKVVEVPDELIDLLKGSRLSTRNEAEQVKAALAVHLFQEGIVSVGKAASLAGIPRVEFEWLLVNMGITTVRYDRADYELDRHGIAEAESRTSP